MKICTNCGTYSKVAAEKCPACNMPGSLVDYEGHLPSPTPSPKEDRQCSNCGTMDIGHGTKCQHCRFPIAARPKASLGKEVSIQPRVAVLAQRKQNYHG